MNTRNLVCTLSAAALILTGCGTSGPDETSEPTVQPPAVSSTESLAPPRSGDYTGTDGTPLPIPDPVRGVDEAAAAASAERFLMGWANYRTFADQPRSEWFATWDDVATPSFVQQQRIEFDRKWAWAWNEEKQVLGAQVDGEVRVDLSDDNAVVRVPIKRYVYGILSRADDAEIETKTYDVYLQLDQGQVPLVDNVREVRPDDPFPPRPFD